MSRTPSPTVSERARCTLPVCTFARSLYNPICVRSYFCRKAGSTSTYEFRRTLWICLRQSPLQLYATCREKYKRERERERERKRAREREREKERERCKSERERESGRAGERERECVCVYEREKEINKEPLLHCDNMSVPASSAKPRKLINNAGEGGREGGRENSGIKMREGPFESSSFSPDHGDISSQTHCSVPLSPSPSCMKKPMVPVLLQNQYTPSSSFTAFALNDPLVC
jgi:hypothetical protein